jgi:hypothetical protein
MSGANPTVLALVESLGSSRFWGILTIKFQSGEAVHITKEESIQPEPKNRRTYDQHSN